MVALARASSFSALSAWMEMKSSAPHFARHAEAALQHEETIVGAG